MLTFAIAYAGPAYPIVTAILSRTPPNDDRNPLTTRCIHSSKSNSYIPEPYQNILTTVSTVLRQKYDERVSDKVSKFVWFFANRIKTPVKLKLSGHSTAKNSDLNAASWSLISFRTKSSGDEIVDPYLIPSIQRSSQTIPMTYIN